MTKTFFFTPSLRGVRFFLYTVGGFFNKREYSGADWLDLLLNHKAPPSPAALPSQPLPEAAGLVPLHPGAPPAPFLWERRPGQTHSPHCSCGPAHTCQQGDRTAAGIDLCHAFSS